MRPPRGEEPAGAEERGEAVSLVILFNTETSSVESACNHIRHRPQLFTVLGTAARSYQAVAWASSRTSETQPAM
ncbi:MAG: hypothetical protein KDA89_17975, partial [Planctomycetaceae bacterium]|nr:hypothetical protein [Planctomycetaceae bacterium]